MRVGQWLLLGGDRRSEPTLKQRRQHGGQNSSRD